MPRLTRYLQIVLGSHELVEDVRHEVLLVVWNQAGQYQAIGRVSTWLFGIARNKALKARARTAKRLPTPSVSESVNESNPEHRLVLREQVHQMRRALNTLPPTQREVLLLTYEHAYSAQAIATHQECSIATVRYRLRQARRHLATALSAQG